MAKRCVRLRASWDWRSLIIFFFFVFKLEKQGTWRKGRWSGAATTRGRQLGPLIGCARPGCCGDVDELLLPETLTLQNVTHTSGLIRLNIGRRRSKSMPAWY